MVDFKKAAEALRLKKAEAEKNEVSVTMTDEQEKVLELVKGGRNALITGSAGTGKSTLLREMVRRFDGDLPICASTGIAAVNVGGMTLHSWAGIGLAKDPAKKIARQMKERQSVGWFRLRDSKRLAIDEVSMISGHLFSKFEEICRLVRGSDKPFGGMQIILFGDFLQLPPVTKTPEDELNKFAFQSDAWRSAEIAVVMLRRVFRQADAEFSAVLNDVRIGQVTPAVRKMLGSRYRKADPDTTIEPVTLYCHNGDVDQFNGRRLDQLAGEAKEFQSIDAGKPGPLETLRKNCLAPENLRLKTGAQVMCLKNLDPEGGLANGSLGVVVSFIENLEEMDKFLGHAVGDPIVKFGVREIKMKRAAFELKNGREIVASRQQFPLRLAWAITAHKCQGMTLEKVRVSLAEVFEDGQAYVALSRVKTIEGLFIESTKAGCIRANEDAVKFYAAHA